jgi:HEAT repeat protein
MTQFARRQSIRCQYPTLILLIGLAAPAIADDEKKKSPFEEKAYSIVFGCALPAIEYGLIPVFAAWPEVTVDGKQPFKGFREELVKALESPDETEHLAAVEFIQTYSFFTRGVAAEFNHKTELDAEARRAFAADLPAIEARLLKALDAPNPRIRLAAATSLMAFGKSNEKAKRICLKGLTDNDENARIKALERVGGLLLSDDATLKEVALSLKDKSAAVRDAGAGAIIFMGARAKNLVPALIEFLETGDTANGRFQYPLAITIPIEENLALLGLSAMGEQAKPAVPTIVRRFPKAKSADKRKMLRCLLAIGADVKGIQPLADSCLSSGNFDLKLAAAFACLGCDPNHKDASVIVRTALASEDWAMRKQTLDNCYEMPPRNKESAALIVPLLDDKKEDVRIAAALALGQIGPAGEAGVPAMEKILRRKQDGSECTFMSHRRTAQALRHMGKPGIAALLRIVESKVDSRGYAIEAVSSLGKDVPEDAIKGIIDILKNEEGTMVHLEAVLAVVRIGPRAEAARPLLRRALREEGGAHLDYFGQLFAFDERR